MNRYVFSYQTITPGNHRGFTLINLLAAMAISGIVASIGLPAMSEFLTNNQVNTAYNRLFSLVQFTRVQAVNFQSQALICPTSNQTDCVSDWNRPLMVFIDSNEDEVRNDNEALLQLTEAVTGNKRINWQGSGSSRYLRFKFDGATRNQNGRLTYCLQTGNNIYARQIIVYRTGRSRKGDNETAEGYC